MCIDSTPGHAVFCCMDVFSRYHQIFMGPSNNEKTTFISLVRVFNYKIVPFGVKMLVRHTNPLWIRFC